MIILSVEGLKAFFRKSRSSRGNYDLSVSTVARTIATIRRRYSTTVASLADRRVMPCKRSVRMMVLMVDHGSKRARDWLPIVCMRAGNARNTSERANVSRNVIKRDTGQLAIPRLVIQSRVNPMPPLLRRRCQPVPVVYCHPASC